MLKPSRITMRSEISKEAVIYEVYVDEVVVWRRLAEIRHRNRPERVAKAREQERVAFRLAAAEDPMLEAKRLRGPGHVAEPTDPV